jgi:hypothetical protein
LVEQLLADDAGVETGDEITIDDDPAGVIGVAQHLVQFVCGDGLFTGPPTVWAVGEAEVGHGYLQAV